MMRVSKYILLSYTQISFVETGFVVAGVSLVTVVVAKKCYMKKNGKLTCAVVSG